MLFLNKPVLRDCCVYCQCHYVIYVCTQIYFSYHEIMCINVQQHCFIPILVLFIFMIVISIQILLISFIWNLVFFYLKWFRLFTDLFKTIKIGLQNLALVCTDGLFLVCCQNLKKTTF